MPVLRRCHFAMRRRAPHVVTLIKIEDDREVRHPLRENVECVEQKAGRPLQSARAAAGPEAAAEPLENATGSS
jgi:hypothetical protein